MGGINQIINIYSNINCMTDQQKGYGLGIILGFRLPCPRGARGAGGGRCECVRRGAAACGLLRARVDRCGRVRTAADAAATSGARAPASPLYPHITSTYIRRDKFDQNVNTVCVENNIGSYFFMLN